MRRLGKSRGKKLLRSSKAAQKVQAEDVDPDKPIYYFAYGALVNPIARQRRDVNTDEAHAALLPNYRLTFSGGIADIMPKTGWEVYGVVMKCSSIKDWNLLKDFDAGYDCVEVDVFPLKPRDSDAGSDNESIAEEDEGFAQVQDTPIRARVFVLPQEKLDQAEKNIPQERYLKVIASGMEAYGVDPDYIKDEIMGVEFIPSRTPENYLTFPPATTPTPSISISAWNKECQKRLQKAARRSSKANTILILFRLGEHAIQSKDAPADNPFCVWLRDRVLGPDDSTWVIVQTFFDPDLPLIAGPEEVTEVHQKWAENIVMERFQQAGIQGTTIYNVEQTSPTVPEPTRLQAAMSSMQQSISSLRRSDQSSARQSTDYSATLSGGDHDDEHSPSPPPSERSGKWSRLRSKIPIIRGSSRGTSSQSSSVRKSHRQDLDHSQTSVDQEGSPLYNIHTKLIQAVPEASSDHFCEAGDFPACPHPNHHDHSSHTNAEESDDVPPITSLSFDMLNETNVDEEEQRIEDSEDLK